jgi:hypothetical protein
MIASFILEAVELAFVVFFTCFTVTALSILIGG